MGLDSKDIQACTWMTLKFSMSTCYRCLKILPFVLGISLFIAFLYRFLPSVFGFLIHSSPVLVCTAVLLRLLLSYEHPNIKNIEGDKKRNHWISSHKPVFVEGDPIVDIVENSSIQTRTGRRRNVEKNKEGDAQGGKGEEDMDLATTPNYDLIGKTALIEENPKEIREEKLHSSWDREESTSLNASNAEKVLRLDENHTVLDYELSKPDFVSLNSSDRNSERSHKIKGGGIELEAESSEEAQDEDEEEAQEDGNKTIEWTEDDQKNLMDLGTSELERNKRLESLIAKRRARKLFRMHAVRNLIDLNNNDTSGQIAPILIVRSNPFDLPNNSNESECLLMPSSAPSILLPTRNPFDLPYDPLEEKPNLMGDSFQQEFMAATQEICYCRHESFNLGASFSGEHKQDRRDTQLSPEFVFKQRASEGPGYSRFRRQSEMEDLDKLTEQESYQEGKPMLHTENSPDHVKQEGHQDSEVSHEEDRETDLSMIEGKGEDKENTYVMESRLADRSEVHMKPELLEDNNCGSSSSSSSEVNEQIFNANKDEVSENLEPTVDNFPGVFSNSVQKSFTCSISRNKYVEIEDNGQTNESLYDSSSNVTEQTGITECILNADKRTGLTPTYSIASDLQVEVSDGGSPPLMVDGTISSMDGESLIYDEDVEKDITSGSEEMWGDSSHLSGVEENESRSREVHEISEHDLIQVGFSGLDQNSEDPIASSVLPEQVVEQDLTDMHWLSSPRTDSPEESRAHLMDCDQKIHDEIEQVVPEEIGKPRSSNFSDALSPENLAFPALEKEQHLTETLVIHPSHDGDSEKPEEPANSPEKSTREVSNIYNVNGPVVHANDDRENLISVEDIDGEAQILNKQEAVGNLSKSADETNSKSIEYIEGKSEKLGEYQTILESYKPVEENDNSKSIEDLTGEFEKLTEHKGTVGKSKPIKDKDNLKLIQDSEVEQGITEVGFFGVNQSSIDPLAKVVQPELVVEQVPINSSSSSSPKSELLQKVMIDQVSSLNIERKVHIDFQQSDVEDMMRNNPSDELPPEHLTLTMPQNAQHLMEDSISHPFNNSDFEKSQELSNPQGKSNEEANIFYNVTDQSVVHEREGKENFKSIESIKGESQIFISHKAAAELSKPAEETNSRSNEDMEGVSENLTECESTVSPLNPAEENDNLNIPSTMEPPNPPEKSTKEAIVDNVNESVVSEKDDKVNVKSVEDSEGGSQLLIRQEAVVEPLIPAEVTMSRSIEDTDIGPSKPIEEKENSSTIKDTEEFGKLIEREDFMHPPKPADAKDNFKAIKYGEGESEKLAEYAVNIDPSKPAEENDNSSILITVVGGEEPSDPPPGKYTEEADTIYNVNESVLSEMDDKENLKSLGDSEGESQRLIRH